MSCCGLSCGRFSGVTMMMRVAIVGILLGAICASANNRYLLQDPVVKVCPCSAGWLF